MTTNILIETVIKFIRGEPKNAELSLLVAEAVPAIKARLRDEVIQRVRAALTEFTRQSSAWALRVHEGGRPKRVERIHLYRKNRTHWVADEFHGVWFVWDRWLGPGSWVGVQWPIVAESFVKKEDLLRYFRSDSVTSQKEDRSERKTWFARAPFGSEWCEWPSLLAKSDEELQKHAGEVVDLMERLAKAIDEAESTRNDEANRVGH